jgi:F420-0:gamma-glutamyl ligase
MAVRVSTINRKGIARLRLRVLVSQVRAAELPALELSLLPEDVDESFADVAEEVAERCGAEFCVIETGLDGD